MKRFIAIIISFMILCGCYGCSNPETPAGHEGYVFEQPRVWGKGGYQGSVKGPGNYGVSIWNNKIINIDMRPKTYTVPLTMLTSDDLKIKFEFSMVIGIKDNSVVKVVESYGGGDWYERFVSKPFETFVRDSVQSHNTSSIKSNVDTIITSVKEKLQNHLKDSPFNLITLAVGNIEYPEQVAAAAEKKMAADQLLEEKNTRLKIASKDAEIRIKEAEGIAKSQQIINETLTPYYLQHEAINAQREMANSPNHTTVYIPVGSNGIPLVYDATEK